MPSTPENDPLDALPSLLSARPWQVAMIGLGMATAQLDTSVNIAFPAISRGFALSIGEIQWVVICYVLTYASLLLAFGRISDTVGHAVVFRAGLVWSTVALLLVGWSPSFGAMLFFRGLQGIGAALVLSCGVALLTSLYGEDRRSHALGIYTMMLSLGWMLGPLLGGALTAAWDWPSVFWFRVPIAVASLLFLRGVPASLRRQATDRFDAVGGVALGLGLVTMLFGINRVRELSAIWLGLLSALSFAAFIYREKRAARPVIAFDILTRPGFALLNLLSVLINFAAFSVWLLVPYFLARVPFYSLTESGAILAMAAAGAALSAPIAGRLAERRISTKSLAISGAVTNGLGLLLLSAWTEQTPTFLRITGLVIQGAGLGFFQTAYADIVTAALPLKDRGVAGSLVLLTRTFGTVTAASVVFLVFEILSSDYGFLVGFQKTFQFAAAMAFAAAALSLLSHRRIRDPS
ncbi:MFS transporter [Bradyrhizobium jicamae]|uniref:MFS transporter n=1 Tax=Bradyrhizobium jicamae TaxID=280332 RepID=A0ABS5FY85_9BRAD|nr:MFS transporter [Bradyrhizobium jicamae]MBR0801211.1 MFS transporter [Bradyrhizobium jicamae]